MKDYYYVIGIKRDSSIEEVKKAYKKLALKFHPDQNNGDKFFEERFKDIQEAYEILSDVNKRKHYDLAWLIFQKGKAAEFQSKNHTFEKEEKERREKEFEKEKAEFDRKKKEFESEKKFYTQAKNDTEKQQASSNIALTSIKKEKEFVTQPNNRIYAIIGIIIIGILLFSYLNMRDSSNLNTNQPVENKHIAQEEPKINIKDIEESMVFVMGGAYRMGSNFEDESPIHEVKLDSFYIGKYEVTQSQFQKIMGYVNVSTEIKNYDNSPASFVSWDEAHTFISKLNNLSVNTYRLPTEAEWEFAAKGGIKSKGYKFSGSNSIDDIGWTANGNDKFLDPQPVGLKKPNELYLYDMSGNVWEWCEDWYDENYYKNSQLINPQGPKQGTLKVLRGGDVNSGRPYFGNGSARVTNRLDLIPDRNLSVGLSGFRLVRKCK